MKNRWLSFAQFALVLPGALTGCLSLEKSYPETRYFALSTTRTDPPVAGAPGGVLAVRPFRISPSYSGREFVYRTGDVTFESDFYNEFFTPPSRQVTTEARRWLEASGIFETVIESASAIEPDYLLEGAIQALYGEYTQSAAPRAVVELQFFLLVKDEVRLQETYKKSVELPDDTAVALVRGWNEALEQVFTELEGNLLETLKQLTRAPRGPD